MRVSDCRCPSHRTSLPSLGNTSGGTQLSLPQAAACGSLGPGVGNPVAPAGKVTPRRSTALPGSWGTPMCLCPALGPRQDRLRQAMAASRLGPRSQHDEGSHIAVISGLHHTALALAVYASPVGLPTPDARLASGCWPSSTRRDWLPAGSHRKVSTMYSLHHFPLSQASWRRPRPLSRLVEWTATVKLGDVCGDKAYLSHDNLELRGRPLITVPTQVVARNR